MNRQLKEALSGAISRSIIGVGLCAAPLVASNLDDRLQPHAVLSRIELPTKGTARAELSLQHVDGKRYLYAHQPGEGALTVLDVTNEYAPRLLKTSKHDHLSQPASLHPFPGGTLLVSQSNAAGSTANREAGYNLYVLNTAGDPVAKPISAAAGHLLESRRGLLYVIDDGGLAIIRVHESPEDLDHKRWAETIAP